MLPETLNEPWNAWIVAGSVLSALTLFQAIRSHKRQRLPLPPGPRGLPLIGNLLDIPQDKPWKVYSEWAGQYGDVVYFHAMGQSFIVLNSLTVVNDLLSARAAKYSDRMESPIVDMTELSWNFVMKQYGDDWRNHRRTFHRFFNQTQVSQYRPALQEEVFRLLDRLLSSPQVYHEVLHEFFAINIMRAAYGSEDYQYNKQLIHQANTFNLESMASLKTGALFVGIVHSLRHVPSWLPGAGWKHALRKIALLGERVKTEPFETAKERFNTGVQQDQGLNAATKLIADLPPADSPEYRYQEEVARQVTAACYLAGSDTTDSSALALIYALATHPEVQRKAQQEIDLVAVIKEASRWHSVVPLGVPRVSTCEDDYMGYRIPEKTIILPNTWAILHSSEHFDDPMAFKPERYLKDGKINPNILDPEAAAFGICPGRHFSTQALMTMVTSVLACFDIQPPKDEKGQEVPMGPMDVASLTVAAPMPFGCSIAPRSEQHVELIKSLTDVK
ncbi:O-methylsterigmatocystin oxidoreductase [Coprinopsis sp. MPI-PUGE-AT-0042]|nr:O-methylsterigmatocystin oxidoreductase [Coprinopsis sp. MPI-PUGE-AT-0042]